MPTPHRGVGWGGCFIILCAEAALITKAFETEWYMDTGILLVQSEGNASSIHMHQSARSYPTGNGRWTSWRALLLWR